MGEWECTHVCSVFVLRLGARVHFSQSLDRSLDQSEVPINSDCTFAPSPIAQTSKNRCKEEKKAIRILCVFETLL